MEDPRDKTRIESMETSFNSKVLWLLAALCMVPVCRAATDGSPAPVDLRRGDQVAHASGQANKLLANIGATGFERSVGRFDNPSYRAPQSKPAAIELAPQSEQDAVRAELGNLSWQSRAKTVEEAGRRFHQEGIPLAHLWQSTSSSVSLGLNPDRKPGIWFVKRFP